MKNANVWVICGIFVLSLILGFVAPPEQSARGLEASRSDVDLGTIGTCAPFVVKGVRYVPVDLRFDPEPRSAAFSF